jgi:hypothetical protein
MLTDDPHERLKTLKREILSCTNNLRGYISELQSMLNGVKIHPEEENTTKKEETLIVAHYAHCLCAKLVEQTGRGGTSQLTLVPSPVCSSTAPFTGSPRHSSELGGPIFQ